MRRLKYRSGPLFISWIGYHGRSAALAKELEAEAVFVATGRTGNVSSAPIRHAFQAFHTVGVLLRKRPRTVIVMAPPLPLVALAWVVGKLMGSRLIIDAHTGVFNDPKWAWTMGVFLWLARRSRLTIVTNTQLVNELERAGVEATALHDPPSPMPTTSSKNSAKASQLTQDTVVVPCSFSSDEPIEAVIAAAKRLPSATFYFTGSPPRRFTDNSAQAPANVVFIGYLPQEEYENLLRAATMVISLTTREYTMQRAGYEALSYHRPLLTSNTHVLREYFSKGAVFTSPRPDDIHAGVLECLENQHSLANEMSILHRQKLASWRSELDRVKKAL